MSITNTLNSVQNSLSSLTTSLSNVVNSATSTANTDFSALLNQVTENTAPTPTVLSAANPAAGKADFVSGQIGVNLKGGVPAEFVYFDAQGNTLRKSSFTAQSLLKNSERFGINLTDTLGLKQQLESAQIGYKPYELYPGTGSDHGINFDDLLAGGLGSAYDWRRDDQAALKDLALVGTAVEGQASNLVIEARALADRLGLVKNSQVTTERGIDPNRLTSLIDGAGQTVSHVVYTGGTASWYGNAQAAQQAQASLSGITLDLTDVAVPSVYLEQDASEAEIQANSQAIVQQTSVATQVSSNTATLATSTPTTSSTLGETMQPETVNTNDSSTASIATTRTLQDQLNDMVASLTNGANISMSSYLNTYTQMQALLARMQSLQQS